METTKARPSNDIRSLGLWWRVVGAVALALIIALGSLEIVRMLIRPLALLILAIVLAEAVAPVVAFFEQRIPRLVAIILIYLMFLGLLVILGWFTIPTLIAQIQELSARIPTLLDQLWQRMGKWDLVQQDVLYDALRSQISSISSALLAFPFSLVSIMTEVLFVFVLSAYWLIESRSLRGFFLSFWPDNHRERVDAVLQSMGQAMGGFMRGVLIDGAIVAVLTYIGLTLIGVDYPLLLAVVAAFLEFVPMIGPFIAGALMVGSALLQSTTKALIVLVFIIVLQQVESNILVPNIMKKATDLSPLLGLMALVIGGTLGGLLGALVSIPIAAALNVLVGEVIAPTLRAKTNGGIDEAKSE